jgi:hypothetical protein
MYINSYISNSFDKNKKNILFCDLLKTVNHKNIFISRFFFNTAKILSKHFNIFWIINAKTNNSVKVVSEMFPEISFICINISNMKFETSKTNDDYININKTNILNIIKTEFPVNTFHGIFLKTPMLQIINNEYFDNIDKNVDKKITDFITKTNDKILNKFEYPYTRFMTQYSRFVIDAIEYFINKDNTKIYQFTIDPASYTRYFNDIFNSKAYYFNDDHRGTRQLNEFPIGQLNYLYNYELNTSDIKEWKDKNNNLIWGGLVLFEKGDRMNDYMQFLSKFNFDKCDLFISPTNSTNVKKKPPKMLLKHPLYNKVSDDIKNNPLNHGFLPNNEFEEKLKDYKYTLILKCISANDSVNFRIYYSLLYNIIPLIAYNYDPDNIQIPEKFYKYLRFNNYEEIIDKINYFNNNPEFANNLLNEMKEYYLNEKYFSKEYYEKEFKENYFKEIF